MGCHTLSNALGANVYISEGRNIDIIEQLKAVARSTPRVALAHVFVDAPYHRTGFTLVSDQPQQLAAAAVLLSRSALALLDLRAHDASHPRLGIVDHVSLHPLGSLTAATTPAPRGAVEAAGDGRGGEGGGGERALVWTPPEAGVAGLAAAAACARAIGQQLALAPGRPAVAVTATAAAAAAARTVASSGRGSNGNGSCSGGLSVLPAAGGASTAPAAPAVPVYLYGAAHPEGRGLADVRRQLGYFRSSPDGAWRGPLGIAEAQPPLPPRPDPFAPALPLPPDLGPHAAPARSGVATIGAAAWVVNYNVPILGADLATAKQLARAVSERGGGLRAVQAMALLHADASIEVACNLLAPEVSPPSAVQAALEAAAARLAGGGGVESGEGAGRGGGPMAAVVGRGYTTNRTPEQLLRAAAAALAAVEAAEAAEAEGETAAGTRVE